jgi:hypothetical protein
VGLEQDPLSLVRTTEELLGRKSSSPSLETENMAMGIRCGDVTPQQTNSVALVCERITPTERPPLVGGVRGNGGG